MFVNKIKSYYVNWFNSYRNNALIIGILCLVEFLGLTHLNIDIAFATLMSLWFYMLLFSMSKGLKYVTLLLFTFMFFLFLLGRPFISWINWGTVWYYDQDIVHKVCLILFISLVSIFIGYRVYDYMEKHHLDTSNNKKRTLFQKYRRQIQLASLIMFLFSLVCELYAGMDQVWFMMGKSYDEFYTSYVSSVPFVINAFAETCPYFLAFFLTTLPSKFATYVSLICYVTTGIPSLIVGSRGAIMEALVFCFVYFAIRHAYDRTPKYVWLDKFEKTLIIVLIPVLIVGLGAYNYIRQQDNVPTINPIYLVTDFFYKQGTSSNTVCQGIEFEEELRNSEHLSYTFGEIIDTTLHGTIAQVLFDAKDLGSGNNLTKAYQSNYLAHHLSYLVLQERYLEGQGRGTSFVIENYIDFGYIGVGIFSFLLGIVLSILPNLIYKKNLVASISLVALTRIFVLSRQPSMSPFVFLFTPHFYISLVILGTISLFFVLLTKKKGLMKIGKIN